VGEPAICAVDEIKGRGGHLGKDECQQTTAKLETCLRTDKTMRQGGGRDGVVRDGSKTGGLYINEGPAENAPGSNLGSSRTSEC